MGCCNKTADDRPISRGRYAAGLVGFVGAQATAGLFLAVGSLVSRRCRKLRRFHRAWAWDRLRSVARREGFRVGGPAAACEPGGDAR